MQIVNIFHKVATRCIRKLQSILGLITLGPRAIILNTDNHVLLVKHTYQPHWYLPGGGVKKGESVKAALLRELNEEVGLVTDAEPELFGIYFNNYLNVNDYPVIYVIKKYSIIEKHSLEIEQKAWFSFDQLPEMVSPGTKRRLNEYFSQSIKIEQW